MVGSFFQEARNRGSDAGDFLVGRTECEAHAVVEAPDDEVPCGAVPQAAQTEGDEAVGHTADGAVAASAEGNVDVVANPGAERDVPALPEILDVSAR